MFYRFLIIIFTTITPFVFIFKSLACASSFSIAVPLSHSLDHLLAASSNRFNYSPKPALRTCHWAIEEARDSGIRAVSRKIERSKLLPLTHSLLSLSYPPLLFSHPLLLSSRLAFLLKLHKKATSGQQVNQPTGRRSDPISVTIVVARGFTCATSLNPAVQHCPQIYRVCFWPSVWTLVTP